MPRDRKPIYLITENFPFGDGEGSFVVPELGYLKEAFDVTIVSLSLSSEQTDALDTDIKLLHHDRRVNPIRKLMACLKLFTREEGWKEIGEILSGKGNKWVAFRESILFFGEAERFRGFLRKDLGEKNDSEIILYNYWYFWGTLACTMLKDRYPKLKVITRSHRFDLYDEGYDGGRQPFKRYMNQRVDRIFFIAEHGRKYFLDRYKDQKDILLEKCVLSRLGVLKPFDSVSDNLSGNDGVFTLVSCSVIIPRKRVELIIQGLSLIDDVVVKWVHFGDGVESQKIKELSDGLLGPKDNISYCFKGNVDSREIQKYYAENCVDAFITTSASEGCPVSVQEAMAYGIPIIGTAINEIPYMINGNGVLLGVDPTDVEVKEAIELIAGMSKEEVARMRQKSEDIYKEEFDARKNYKRFVELVGEV